MTVRTIIRLLALLGSLTFAIGACGGPAATASPGATQPGGATQPPVTATQDTSPTDGGMPTIDTSSFHADVELEELFPEELGGKDLTVLSMSGGEFMGSASPELDAALRALGKSGEDLSVAFGGAGTTSIIAFQVEGVPGSSILDALFDAYEQTGEAAVTDMTFAGKGVKKVFIDAADSYIYAARDVVFIVGGKDITDAQLTEAFSKLP